VRTLRQQAALVIRSLLREGRFSDHIVTPKGESSIVASNVVADLESEATLNGLNDGDAALAIGEHAFRAGFAAGQDAGGDAAGGRQFQTVDAAWSDYEPSEDVKALS
jgi:hypothetical protein